MAIEKEKLKETIGLFLYCLLDVTEKINVNTFKRYIYLYYFVKRFLRDDLLNLQTAEDKIIVNYIKGDFEITDYDDALSYFLSKNCVSENDNSLIIIKEAISELFEPLIKNQQLTARKYAEIRKFVTLLSSYDDQFIFTIFFSEPTFETAINRNEGITSNQSELSKLLYKFKKKNKEIIDADTDGYDILAYWMNFILRHYYDKKKEVKTDE